MPATGRALSSICWFRRDLRLSDNGAMAAALAHARASGGTVLPVFVFETDILDLLPDPDDRRVAFIAGAVADLDRELRRRGGGLLVLRGSARREIPRLVRELGPVAVFASGDHEPFGTERDRVVARELEGFGSRLVVGLDHELFDPERLRTGGGAPFRVFSPYFRAWTAALEREPGSVLARRDSLPAEGELSLSGLHPTDSVVLPERMGIRTRDLAGSRGAKEAAQGRLELFLEGIDRYAQARDFPCLEATSRLSVDLRFGTLSLREAVRRAREIPSEGAAKWLAELAWRDFHQALLHHFPASVDRAFQARLEGVVWDDPERDPRADVRWDAWTEGRTGFPFVDAALRELRATGWLHNRGRMVVASFLTKDLHIHWKRGERWFGRHLVDIELASNVGGWQWAASTGADGQPWFRVFNPVEQGRRWDPEGTWVRKWCPEIAALPDRWIHAPWEAPAEVARKSGLELGVNWPRLIVDHAVERREALERFGRLSAR